MTALLWILAVLLVVATLMTLVLLPAMLVMERRNFFRAYDREIIRRVSDKAAADDDRG